MWSRSVPHEFSEAPEGAVGSLHIQTSPFTDAANKAPRAAGRPQGPAEAGGWACPGGKNPSVGPPRDPRRTHALTGRVVEVQGHLLAAHGHAGRVLLEHGWGVVLWEKGSGWSSRVRAHPYHPHPTRLWNSRGAALERVEAIFPRSGRRGPWRSGSGSGQGLRGAPRPQWA